MSRSCELKSKKLEKDLIKIGFDLKKGGFINLCASCCKKYGSKSKGSSKKCVFGCN